MSLFGIVLHRWKSQGLGSPHLLSQEKSWAKKISLGLELCCHRGAVVQVISSYSHPLQCIGSCIVFASMMHWNLVAGNLGFHKVFSATGDFLRQCSLGTSAPCPRGAEVGLWAIAGFITRTGVYIYHPVLMWVRLLCFVAYGAISHSSQKHFCSWLNAKLLFGWGCGHGWRMSYSAMLLI